MAVTIDGNLGVTSPDFEPSSSTTPTNGLFLPATNALGFATNSTERLRIDASGNLGVGTSSPNQKLQVYTSAGTGGQIQIGNSSTGSASTDGVLFGFDASNDVTLTNQEATAIKIINATAREIAFYTTNTERARIDSSGNLLVGVTSATSGGGVIQVSNGITFPATQSASSNANTLDDYEEGTWTPNVSSNNGNGTFATKSGTYTKVGRLVTITFMVDGGNSLAAGTTQYLAGLPFPCYSSYAANMIVGQLGSNGPTVRTQQLMTNSANRSVLYIYTGGTQETTTITYASGTATYLTDN